MTKLHINNELLNKLSETKLVRKGIALILAGTSIFGLGACSKQEPSVSDENTKTFVYSFEDEDALDVIPYLLEGFHQSWLNDIRNVGKERNLERKYTFDTRSYYHNVLAPEEGEDLFLLGHNEACDCSSKKIWDAFKDPEKKQMSRAYLNLEFKPVFPDPERYAEYFGYLGYPNIFDVSVDYQILKSESNNYYLLKTYKLTLKKQPNSIKNRTWPVGQSFEYTVFAKINLTSNRNGHALYDHALYGLDIIAENYEGIGSDTAKLSEGAVNLNDVLHPVEKAKTLSLKKGE